jgi:flagellar basal body P-ring protein FlgI
LAAPFNMYPLVVENVGLVTGLKGTGSDPRPSSQRSELLGEMHRRGVELPNALLESKNASLVVVHGILRPGIQKGDRFDVELRVPSQSETTSLRGGYLLETRLKELAVMQDHKIHEGHDYGVVEGPVLVDPSATEKTGSVLAGRGRILGGGVALKSLPVGLALRQGYESIGNAARVELAINRRFYQNEKGIKVGVAKAKNEHYIELKVHPRYKDNAMRYMAVVRSTVLKESEHQLADRLRSLERQLLDPVNASRAALQLEAIGRPAVEILARAIRSDNPEVRFYAAETLAYLDDSRAVPVLGEAARNEPAFRVFALSALSLMNDYAATDQLQELMKLPSAETRYGAFRALSTMSRQDPSVKGENLGGQFSYHIIEGSGPLMIHVTRSHRPEIVLFGRDQRLSPPLALEAGNRILVTASKPGEIVVSKFSVNEPDQKRIVSDRLDEVIRAIVEVGGTYPDVVQSLQQAKATGALSSRLVVDALPDPGRTYERIAGSRPEQEGSGKGQAAKKSGETSTQSVDHNTPL